MIMDEETQQLVFVPGKMVFDGRCDTKYCNHCSSVSSIAQYSFNDRVEAIDSDRMYFEIEIFVFFKILNAISFVKFITSSFI